MTEAAPTPSPPVSRAAVHEAAHEIVAHAYGCRDVRTFVGSDEDGVCYHRLPPLVRWDETAARWLVDDLRRIRARAAVAMAGLMGEALYEQRAVPGFEELLVGEAADPALNEFAFEYGALEEVFNHATVVFSDHRTGARWLEAALPGVHANTRAILEKNWPLLLLRARELEQTLRAA